MAWQWLIRGWLAGKAKHELFAAAEELLRDRLRRQQSDDGAAGPALRSPCAVGLIFATAAEAAGVADQLADPLTVHADGFDVRLGRLGERNVAIICAGTQHDQVAKAAESLILGHRPGMVIAAGFAAPLAASVSHSHVVLASAVLEERDGRVTEFTSALGQTSESVARPRVQVGRVVTQTDQAGRREPPEELGRRLGALAVEPIAAAVAKVCQQHGAPWLAVHAIRQGTAPAESPEVRNFKRQTSLAGKLGAALGAVTKRPSAVKEMLQSAEKTLTTSDRLAEVLGELIGLMP